MMIFAMPKKSRLKFKQVIGIEVAFIQRARNLLSLP